MTKTLREWLRRPARAGVLMVAAALLGIAAGEPAGAATRHPAQLAFDSPEQAGEALVAAVKAGGLPELLRILGPDGREIVSSGDPVADKNSRDAFVSAY